jgi:hypothetical protein
MRKMLAYRFLTGDDSATFCHRVTEALSRGWQLYGNPVYAADPSSGTMRCGQAVVKEVEGEYHADLKLGEL